MAAEIDKIFTATARSTWHFLIESGQGCYIPAYQRPYSWDKDNIARLNEDALHGLKQLSNRPSTISFIGTVIAIHDTRYRTVDPLYRTEVASRVMTIIDGQQRLCTLVMMNMALHDFIRMLSARYAGKSEPHIFWIHEQATQLLADLRNTFLMDRSSGDGNYRFYPRVIRAYDDAWSRRQGQAKYESPIAKLIWGYIDHTEKGNTSEYKFGPLDAQRRLIERYAAVVDAFDYMKREVRQLCQTKFEDREFPELVTATQSNDFASAIWGYPVPDDVKKYLAEQSADVGYKDYCSLLRAIIFAKYLNERVAITIVTTDNEDDAFDMFEALNTTGEPLTAFETFKPKVIDAETLPKYEQSPSRKSVAAIEAYLDRFRKADDKQRATSEMLVPFALAESGTKLQKKLNDQRRYLRDEFDSLKGDIDKSRTFVAGLAGVASFMRSGWDIERGRSPHFAPLDVKDEEAIVGFEALRGLKHSITIAPLARFYQHAVDGANVAERTQRTADFIGAIKATAAFSAYWRAAKGGTENIDSHYREIMRNGIKAGAETIPFLARRVDDKLGALSLLNYKKALRAVLEEKGNIKSKDDWVKLAAKIPVYKHSTTLARFLIFCASDDTMPDPAEKGLIIAGRKGVSPMLKTERWNDGGYFTVEHIAPQSGVAGWDQSIYDDPDTVHVLGNLTLLPEAENGVISNKSWAHKRMMYGLLSAETHAKFDQLTADTGSVGLTLSKTAQEVLGKAKYLGLCKTVATFEKDWDKAIVEKRSARLAELAWDKLHPWLYS
ncbi:DUF262 domain-containing HNH endonuclease family protein [Rhodopseudomonas pseudopalustris]|uniref:DUF262 domain-containing protein n=1 Tax=Rhodopseudomonas pseudopalustris TaxID=1513892 RepID=UPI003F994809